MLIDRKIASRGAASMALTDVRDLALLKKEKNMMLAFGITLEAMDQVWQETGGDYDKAEAILNAKLDAILG